MGNRTVQTQTITATEITTYTYDAANRLATQNGQSLFTWDANGNLLQEGDTTYAYDFANRLISATVSGVNTQFGYNGDGIRLRQIAASTLTTYTQDYAAPLPVVLQAKTGSGTTQYVYSLGTRPLAEYEAATWEYLLPDPLGSVRQIADTDGNVTLLKSYEPYGSVLSSQGNAASVFGYAGEQIDATGLIFLRARYYQARWGLFLSRDPVSGNVMRPGSMNGWGYAEGNPVLFVDPAGKARWCAGLFSIYAQVHAAGIISTAPNAGERLFQLLEDDFDIGSVCAGTTAGDRLEFVLDLTRGFNSDTSSLGLPVQFGVEFGGDCGLAEEFRDSKYYERYDPWRLFAKGKANLTNQPGHFLTAVSLAYLGPGAAALLGSPDVIPDYLSHLSFDDYVALGLVIGHEKLSDARNGRGAFDTITTAVQQYLSVYNGDIVDFLTAINADERGDKQGRDALLEEILNIRTEREQENRVGNSLEDLRLSLKGWRFGKWVQANRSVSHRSAALWLRSNIGIIPSMADIR